ncbi:hypothetical protein K1719_046494 [Acacia pycnantha]|nr:hypothetical protein K1719_046494 [Acacia pycnantha]
MSNSTPSLPSTALAEGRPWKDPPVVKENLGSGKNKPLLPKNGNDGGWDSWDNEDGVRSPHDFKRNMSTGDVRGFNGGSIGNRPSRSKSTQLEASAANKDNFFANKISLNESQPEGVAPSQGGKYVGFGSSPAPPRVNNQQNDVLSVMSQGFGKLSLVVASTAQSAANVVQAGTKEITTKKMIFIKYS